VIDTAGAHEFSSPGVHHLLAWCYTPLSDSSPPMAGEISLYRIPGGVLLTVGSGCTAGDRGLEEEHNASDIQANRRFCSGFQRL
jgi:hypothetical protein